MNVDCEFDNYLKTISFFEISMVIIQIILSIWVNLFPRENLDNRVPRICHADPIKFSKN